MSSIPTGNRHYYYGGGAEKISKYTIFVGVTQCSHIWRNSANMIYTSIDYFPNFAKCNNCKCKI